MKAVWAVGGLLLSAFLVYLGLILIMPQAHTVISDTNIADYTGLSTIGGAAVTLIGVAAFGFSFYEAWQAVKGRHGEGGGSRA